MEWMPMQQATASRRARLFQIPCSVEDLATHRLTAHYNPLCLNSDGAELNCTRSKFLSNHYVIET